MTSVSGMHRWMAGYVLLCTFNIATSSGFSFPPDPATPPQLLAHKDVQPLNKGFVDVTLPPYNASGDCLSDDSAALQSAVTDAYNARMTVFLPGGKCFLLSRQLTFLQLWRSRALGFQIAGGGGKGPRSLQRPPILKLKDNSLVADNIFLLFRLVQNGTISESEHYNSRIRNVDIDLGNNPTVSGLSMSGAQQCSIEDVTIWGESFYAGINGLPGSGGFSVNVNVSGGDYGLVQSQFRPNPSICGLVLQGQRNAGVLVNISRGPVVVSGFRIESSLQPSDSYRAVHLINVDAYKDNSFSGEDGSIWIHGDKMAPGAVAIDSAGGDVVLKNVFVKGASQVLRNANSQVQVPPHTTADNWVHIGVLVATTSGGQMWSDDTNISRDRNDTTFVDPPLRVDVPLPGNFLTKHSWNYSLVPTWQSKNVIDVSVDYGATPQWVNCTDDDGARIQQAIADSCNPASDKYVAGSLGRGRSRRHWHRHIPTEGAGPTHLSPLPVPTVP
eukprot:m.823932 g.823932  ORF g.823932 m.823932 type:complete len:499 (-) comp23405_c0_seq20:1052-2548(-)